MNRERHESTQFVNGSKTDKLINHALFKSLNEIDEETYEVTMRKSTIEHKEPIAIGFFILQYSKLRMLELVYNFFVKYCDRSMYEFIEMDTDSLYMALAADSIEKCIRPDMILQWQLIRAEDCEDDFTANSTCNFFPRECCERHTQHDKREPGLFKEEWRGHEMIALCSKTYCCFNRETQEVKFSSKGLNKNNLEESLNKYRRTLETKENCSSFNTGFRCVNNGMATYVAHKKGISYFYPKRVVMDDGIHTEPLSI